MTPLRLGFAVLAARLIDGARGALLGFAFGNTAVLVGLLDVLVLSIALATFFYSAWHAPATARSAPCRRRGTRPAGPSG